MSTERYLHRNSVSSNKNQLFIRESFVDPREKHSKRKPSKEKNNKLNTHDDYQTDIRHKVTSDTDLELQELRKLVACCEHCKKKLPEFITKKPKDSQKTKRSQSVQTESNLALFELLEQKLQEIQRCNNVVMKQLEIKDREIRMKEEQLVDIEQRFTRLIYKVSEDVFLAQRIALEYNQMKAYTKLCPVIPSYLKALSLDDFVKGNTDG